MAAGKLTKITTSTVTSRGRSQFTRRRNNRNFRKARFGKIARPMKQKIYAFKRDLEETIQISQAPLPEGWTANGNYISKQFAWTLGSMGLTSVAEFQALFSQYKLAGVRLKFFFSNTVSGTDGADHYSNAQLIVRMANNQDGIADTLNSQYWRETQAKKTVTALNGGRPLDIYMPLKVQGEVIATSGGNRTIKPPTYLPISDTAVPHHGLNISIERADGQSFSANHNNFQYVRIQQTLYFKMKGVQ